jgi:hypothetical protein
MAGAAMRPSPTSTRTVGPDVYVLNMQGDNHYFENVGGKTFVEKTERISRRRPGAPWA